MKLVTPLLQRLRSAFAAAGSRLLPHELIHGIAVVDFGSAADAKIYFAHIEQALALIKERDPRRMRRIQRDLHRIAIVRKGGELYDSGIRTYLATGPYLLTRSREENALNIVHEATHARLRGAGIETTAANQERIERLCVEQEVAFARRLPNGDALAEAATTKLSNPWWGRDQMVARHVEQMRGYGVPESLIRLRRYLLGE